MKKTILSLLFFTISLLNAGQHYILIDSDGEESVDKKEELEDIITNTDYESKEIIYQYYPYNSGPYGSLTLGKMKIDAVDSLNTNDKIRYNYLKFGLGLSFVEAYYSIPFNTETPRGYNTDEIKSYAGYAVEIISFKYENFFFSFVAGQQYHEKMQYDTNEYHEFTESYASVRFGLTFGDNKHNFIGGAFPLIIMASVIEYVPSALYANEIGNFGGGDGERE